MLTTIQALESAAREAFRVAKSRDDQVEIARPASIGAGDDGCLVWAREVDRLAGSHAAVAIVPLADSVPDTSVATVLMSANPRLAFARIIQALFAVQVARPGIDPNATIHADAVVSASASIGAGCFVGRAIIAENVVLHPGVVIYDGARLESDVVVHANAVIGADGFGYERDATGTPVKLPHLGGVLVRRRAEIGASSVVDRGTLSDTVIGEDVKIDNLCHIAHNVELGARTMIAANAVIAGSCTIGEDVWIGPQAVVSDGLNVGKGASVTLGSVVTRNVEAGAKVTGNFAIEHRRFLANLKRSLAEQPQE